MLKGESISASEQNETTRRKGKEKGTKEGKKKKMETRVTSRYVFVTLSMYFSCLSVSCQHISDVTGIESFFSHFCSSCCCCCWLSQVFFSGQIDSGQYQVRLFIGYGMFMVIRLYISLHTRGIIEVGGHVWNSYQHKQEKWFGALFFSVYRSIHYLNSESDEQIVGPQKTCLSCPRLLIELNSNDAYGT